MKLMVVTTQKACLIAFLRKILVGIHVAQDDFKLWSIFNFKSDII